MDFVGSLRKSDLRLLSVVDFLMPWAIFLNCWIRNLLLAQSFSFTVMQYSLLYICYDWLYWQQYT
jgi:hypothetical protein